MMRTNRQCLLFLIWVSICILPYCVSQQKYHDDGQTSTNKSSDNRDLVGNYQANLTLHEKSSEDDADSLTLSPHELAGIKLLAEASDSLIYKVSMGFRLYYGPAIAIIGIIGNIISGMIMFQKHNRRISSCIYMGFLSIVDTFPLLVYMIFFFTDFMFVYSEPLILCKFAMYAWTTGELASTLITIAMTADRCFAVVYPLRAKATCTPKKANICCAIIYVVSAIWMIPHPLILAFQLKHPSGLDSCATASRRDTLALEIFNWVELAGRLYLPFLIVIILNSIIIHVIHSRGKELGKYDERNAGMDKKNAAGERSRSRSEESQITFCLLLVAFAFLILKTPWFALQIIYLFTNPNTTSARLAGYMAFLNLAAVIMMTNHGINMFLYCLSGKKFRGELKDLLCFCKKFNNEPGSVSTAKYKA